MGQLVQCTDCVVFPCSTINRPNVDITVHVCSYSIQANCNGSTDKIVRLFDVYSFCIKSTKVNFNRGVRDV